MEEYRKSKVFCLTLRVEAFVQVFREAAFNGNYIRYSDVDGSLNITTDKKYIPFFRYRIFICRAGTLFISIHKI
ncbi:hypothetical protein [Clostridium sp.]|uniref:hypothetical protein n=1 Tax=Clostridium sp. TaxID=1506 RepID=UPI002842925B|nr:hypothetical protein [Clostridium sp.]MDR3596483.1 hypothetical protein [Clostridium sp.]